MRFLSIIWISLPLTLAAQVKDPDPQMDSALAIWDKVDLPGHWLEGEKVPCYIEFHESWIIQPGRSSIQKQVGSYSLHRTKGEKHEQDPVFALGKRAMGRKVRLGEISYEFMLLDAHTPGEGIMGFSEPDSMDRLARRIQSSLADLILDHLPETDRYKLEKQLLSFHLHEEWFIDPASRQITKKVRGITPVIWQRRATTGGDPVNEAGTGLPVYYKNELSRIDLRNL